MNAQVGTIFLPCLTQLEDGFEVTNKSKLTFNKNVRPF